MASVAILCLLTCPGLMAQTTLFSEDMGSPTANTAISSHTFQNSSPITFSGTADVRTTTASSGYTGSSGNGNVLLTGSIGMNFQISGISTVGYSGLSLSFGGHKTTTASNFSELEVSYSTNGTDFTNLTVPTQPTGTGTAVWRLITITLPSATENVSNLRLRFRQTSSSPQFRIDDVKFQAQPVALPFQALPTVPTPLLTARVWQLAQTALLCQLARPLRMPFRRHCPRV